MYECSSYLKLALDRGQDSRGTDTSGVISRHRLDIPNTGNDFHKNNIALVKGGQCFAWRKVGRRGVVMGKGGWTQEDFSDDDFINCANVTCSHPKYMCNFIHM